MGTYTTLVCDKCKKEWRSDDKAEQPVAIAVAMSFGETQIYFNDFTRASIRNEALWCRSCVIKAGVVGPKTVNDHKIAPPSPPSVTDQLITLLEELGFGRQE